MGLDNIPNKYPCKTAGTAVLVQLKNQDGQVIIGDDGLPETQIDCDATQACGGCTWENDRKQAGIDAGMTYGMFGTACWYRGKWGNYLLDSLGMYSEPHISFYGDQDDACYKTPESCRTLANEIANVNTHESVLVDGNEVGNDLRYAIWYLNWAADKTNGLSCWY